MTAQSINPKWNEWFETIYWINGKRKIYRTRNHTDFHKRIHKSELYRAITIRFDKSIKTKQGIFSEIIEKTSKHII